MVVPEPIELYLPKEVKKIIIRKVVKRYADGRKEETKVNEDLLKSLDVLKKYLLAIKIERAWVTESAGEPSAEKVKLTLQFPDISYKIIFEEYDKRSKRLSLDIQYYVGPVIL